MRKVQEGTMNKDHYKIALSKVRLINWYGFNNDEQDISDQITLITGDNGVGKSTLLDAIKYAFDGDSEFNYSASSTTGVEKRTIGSYTRGLINKENNSYLRSVKDYPNLTSHVALLFHNEKDNSEFIIGVIIETDSSNSTSSFYYTIDGVAFDNVRFTSINENNQEYILDHAGFKEKNLVKLMSKNDAYPAFFSKMGLRLGDIQISDFRRKIRNMSAYRPNLNIEAFIKDSVLKEKNVEFDRLREKQTAIDGLTQQLQTLQERIGKIENILKLFERYDDLEKRLIINDSMIVYREVIILKNKLQEINAQKSNDELSLEDIESKLKTLTYEIDNLENELIKAREELRTVDGVEALDEEKNKLKSVNKEISNDQILINKLADFQNQMNILSSFLKDRDIEIYEDENINCLSSKTISFSDKKDSVMKFKERLSTIRDNFVIKDANLASQIKDAEQEILRNRENIQNFKKNLPDYSAVPAQKKLIEKINSELTKRGISERANFICEYVISIKDEAWRDAIEAFLGRHRYAVYVPKEFFAIADKIHDEKEFRYTELINTPLLDKWNKENVEGSVADFLEVRDSSARKYFDFFLGRIKAVSFIDVTKEESAMSKEGKLSRNMGITYINIKNIKSYCLGKDTAERNIALAEKNIKEKEDEKEEYFQEKVKIDEVIAKVKPFVENFAEPDYDAEIKYSDALEKKNALEISIKNIENLLNSSKLFLELSNRCENIQKNLDTAKKEQSELSNKQSYLKADITKCEDELDTRGFLLSESNQKLERRMQDYPVETKEAIILYDKNIHNEKGGKDILIEDTVKYYKNDLQKLSSQIASDEASLALSMNNNSGLPVGDVSSEAESAYRKHFNKIKMDDIVEVNEKMAKEREEYESIFKKEFVLTIYRNCIGAKEDTEDINTSLKKLKYSTLYKFKILLLNENKDDTSDFAKILEYGKYLDEKSRTDDAQISFDFTNGGYDGQFNDTAYDIDALEKDIESIIARILSGNGDKEIEKFSDYREYLSYDILYKDPTMDSFSSLKKQIGYNSGAYRQIPFTLILLASLSMIYDSFDNSVRLFFMDEPFEKMSQANIKTMIDFFKERNFQVIFCAADKMDSIGEQSNVVLSIIRDENYEMHAHEVKLK